VDRETLADVEGYGVERMLRDLQDALRAGKYHPPPVRRRNIPKPDGGVRPLGIPTVRDRVAQMAAKLVLEPIFEADFLPSSYGYRPKRSATEALECIRRGFIDGCAWVLELDIRKYFDTIDPQRLMGLVELRVSDRRVLQLVRKWLDAGVMEDGVLRETVTGTPQGGVISPLLANIYLHVLDRTWAERGMGTLVRYADDAVVMCRSREEAEAALGLVGEVLTELGLELHPDKTRIVDLGEGREGFDFLGCHFHARVSGRLLERGIHRYYLNRWPSARSMKKVRQRVKELTGHNRNGVKDVRVLISDLNPILRGWGNYCVSRGHVPDELKEVRPTIQMAQPASSSPPTGVSPVQVVARVPGSRLAASGGNAWRRSPASRASLEGATERSAASKRSLPRRKTNPKGTRGSRARSIRAKAMEGVKNLEAQRRGTPRRKGRGTFGRWWRELERPSPAPGTAAREQPARITAKREVASSRKGVGWGHT